jgi:hypothetical protein
LNINLQRPFLAIKLTISGINGVKTVGTKPERPEITALWRKENGGAILAKFSLFD